MHGNQDKLLIFDCDGVLVDSEPIANRIFVECLQNEGYGVDEAYALKHFYGIALRDCITHVETVFQQKISEGFIDTLSQLTNGEIKRSLKPIRNIELALEQIRYPKCVASGSDYEKLHLSLEVTGLKKYFDHIFSVDEVERGKPYPDIFLFAAAQLNFEPHNCIVIEDSLAGVQAGLAAGMPVYFYHPSSNNGLVLSEGVTVFYDMAQLPHLIARHETKN